MGYGRVWVIRHMGYDRVNCNIITDFHHANSIRFAPAHFALGEFLHSTTDSLEAVQCANWEVRTA